MCNTHCVYLYIRENAMYTFLLQGHQDHRLQARARVHLSVKIRFYCVHFDISCKSEKYQFCGKIMLWNSGATSGHRETKASWPLPTVTQAMSQNHVDNDLLVKKANSRDETISFAGEFTKGKSRQHTGEIHKVWIW